MVLIYYCESCNILFLKRQLALNIEVKLCLAKILFGLLNKILLNKLYLNLFC